MTLDDRVCLHRPAIPLFLISITLAALGGSARAQSAEAEVLFRDGRRLIQAGRLAEGCDKIEASERLESSVGSLLNLGDCREKLGEYASAWAAFRKAEAKAKHAGDDEKRRAEAHRRAGEVEPKLSFLVLKLEARPEGLVIKRDGEPIDPALWTTAIPIDPGVYEISAEAPARKPWRTSVPIDAKLKRRIVAIPALDAAPPAPPPMPPPVAAAPVTPPATEPGSAPAPVATTVAVAPVARPGARPTWSTTRKVAVGFAAGGAIALGTGAYYGWRSRDLAAQSDERCPTTACEDPEGLRLNDRARAKALRANIAYAAGGAAAVTAVVLWLVGRPEAESRSFQVQPGVAGGVGVTVAGSF